MITRKIHAFLILLPKIERNYKDKEELVIMYWSAVFLFLNILETVRQQRNSIQRTIPTKKCQYYSTILFYTIQSL